MSKALHTEGKCTHMETHPFATEGILIKAGFQLESHSARNGQHDWKMTPAHSDGDAQLGCFIRTVGSCSEFSFSPNVRSVKLFSSNNIWYSPQATSACHFRTRKAIQQHHHSHLVGASSDSWWNKSCIHRACCTITALPSLDLSLQDLCLSLHTDSYSRCCCVGPKLNTHTRWRSKHSSSATEDFKHIQYLLIAYCLTLLLDSGALTQDQHPVKALPEEGLQDLLFQADAVTAALGVPACYSTSLSFLSFRKQTNIKKKLVYNVSRYFSNHLSSSPFLNYSKLICALHLEWLADFLLATEACVVVTFCFI